MLTHNIKWSQIKYPQNIAKDSHRRIDNIKVGGTNAAGLKFYE